MAHRRIASFTPLFGNAPAITAKSSGLESFGTNTTSGRQAATVAMSASKSVVSIALTRMTRSCMPSFGVAKKASRLRLAASFLSGATASSRSKMTASQSSDATLASAR
ncbi:hypothetical protein D3C87_1125690 [compost metagenome]